MLSHTTSTDNARIFHFDRVIITGIVKTAEGWNSKPGARNPQYDKTEIWCSIHGM